MILNRLEIPRTQQGWEDFKQARNSKYSEGWEDFKLARNTKYSVGQEDFKLARNTKYSVGWEDFKLARNTKYSVGWQNFKTKAVHIVRLCSPELGTRQFCLDNATLFSGHKAVIFCNITVFAWLLHLCRHLDRNIFRILSCPRGSITLSRCRCRKAKKLSHAQPYCQYSTVKEDFSKSFFYKPFAGGSLFWIRLNSEQLQFSGSGTQESVTLAFCCATYELSYLLSISMSLPTSLSVSHHISFSEPPHLFSVSHNISFSEPSHLFQ